MMIELGMVAIDRISGFAGIVTARTEHLYSSVRVRLDTQILTKEGTMFESTWFDEKQLDEADDTKGIGFKATVRAADHE